ncbi:MAG: phosphate ABC transporter substrate-binding protein [Candidatus Bathyarchaeia archaeon]
MVRRLNWIVAVSTVILIIIIGASVYVSQPGKIEQPTTQPEKQIINVKGSDTLLILIQVWSENYMNKHPEIKITVSGGGSGTGLAALINRQIDMATASRSINPKEVQDAKVRGVEPVEWKVAIDGISVIVHPSNPLAGITMEQLKAIYNGSYSNWRQLGGADRPINVYGRQSNSGTYIFWQEHILRNQRYRTDMQSLNGNADIVEAVSKDPSGIGYVGVAYAAARSEAVKILSVQERPGSPAYRPVYEHIISGNYPISRYLYIYTDGAPKGPVREFLKFIVGEEGQRMTEQVEYIPLPENVRQEQLARLR